MPLTGWLISLFFPLLPMMRTYSCIHNPPGDQTRVGQRDKNHTHDAQPHICFLVSTQQGNKTKTILNSEPKWQKNYYPSQSLASWLLLEKKKNRGGKKTSWRRHSSDDRLRRAPPCAGLSRLSTIPHASLHCDSTFLHSALAQVAHRH